MTFMLLALAMEPVVNPRLRRDVRWNDAQRSATPLLEVRDLRLEYATSRGPLRAVDGISFDLAEGEALGIIGESGSGKTSLAIALMRLLPRNATLAGRLDAPRRRGHRRLTDEDFRQRVRWSRMAMVFQGAMHSLNPVIRVGDQVGERLRSDGLGKQQVAGARRRAAGPGRAARRAPVAATRTSSPAA